MTDNTLTGRLAGQVRGQDAALRGWEAEREAIRIATETTGVPAVQICRHGALAEAERRLGGALSGKKRPATNNRRRGRFRLHRAGRLPEAGSGG